MDFFNGICIAKGGHRPFVAFGFCLFDEAGIHLLELISFNVDSNVKILLRALINCVSFGLAMPASPQSSG
jgi:hypothetical protein